MYSILHDPPVSNFFVIQTISFYVFKQKFYILQLGKNYKICILSANLT